ncbi:MAG: hypothetical protein CMJ78_01195 [Planctomycetaceae bacterium]|nr:hypothetical protein [Planctomycetaceae bacterium]
MPNVKVEEILTQLESEDSSVSDLLDQYDPGQYEQLWIKESWLYRSFVKALISEDRLKAALDLSRQGLRQFPDDLELLYRRALIHARNRHSRKAEQRVGELVEFVEANIKTDFDILSLAGKLKKDKLTDCRDSEDRSVLATEAAEFYERAFMLSE